MWYCMLKSGIHATIAGVLLAFAIPFINDPDRNPSYKLQHVLHNLVAFVILPIFALANTAIVLPKAILPALSTRNALVIIAGLVGRQTNRHSRLLLAIGQNGPGPPAFRRSLDPPYWGGPVGRDWLYHEYFHHQPGPHRSGADHRG